MPRPTADLSVCLNVEETGGSRLDTTSTGVQTVTILTGQTMVSHTVLWTDDTVDGADSFVTVSVLDPSHSGCSSTGYTPSITDPSASLFVQDDEQTVVSLTSTDPVMGEGDASNTATATVMLSRRLSAGEILEVPLSLTTTTGARPARRRLAGLRGGCRGNGRDRLRFGQRCPDDRLHRPRHQHGADGHGDFHAGGGQRRR